MRRLSLADAFFLVGESQRMPMHVAMLTVYTMPQGVNDSEYLGHLNEVVHHDGELREPFGEKLRLGPLGTAGPMFWQKDTAMDMDYHIRRSALPQPGRFRELFALVSRLHGTMLERSRPLWELHLIEGLPNRQFAVYFKMHHCAIDGSGAMHLLASMYSTSPRSRNTVSPLASETHAAYVKKLASETSPAPDSSEHEVLAVTDVLRQQLGGTVNVAKALQQYARVLAGGNTRLSMPYYQVPRTRLSSKVSRARRFVGQSWPFARIRAVGKAFDGTLNDAVLGMCSGALQRYLRDQNDLPGVSLKAMVPVALRSAGDVDAPNTSGFIAADLATLERDPARRIRAIQESVRAGKEQLSGMSTREKQIFMGIVQAPMGLAMLTRLGSHVPTANVAISNVKGPHQQMYWNGARVDGIYPVSIPVDGGAINFSQVSNHNNLDFGITACRHAVPHAQRMVDYLEEALVELEIAGGLRGKSDKATRGKSGATTRGGTEKKPAAKGKAKSGARQKRSGIN